MTPPLALFLVHPMFISCSLHVHPRYSAPLCTHCDVICRHPLISRVGDITTRIQNLKLSRHIGTPGPVFFADVSVRFEPTFSLTVNFFEIKRFIYVLENQIVAILVLQIRNFC